MKQYKYQNKTVVQLENIVKLLKVADSFGLSNVKDLLGKLQSTVSGVQSEKLRITFLGSFSDGKTSTIAALLGNLDATMKIHPNESSNEIQIYSFPENNIEIIDTPGLFGEKEMLVDGESIKYSDITKKYLSESQVVIYLCDAVTPLKDSHVPDFKWIMRDLGKLESTIFVVNKMDETGYDISNSQIYDKVTQIKKDNLLSRLRTSIDLSPKEEEYVSHRIVCISANPDNEGLEYWFSEEPQEYESLSRIGLLRDTLDKFVNASDMAQLKSSALSSSLHDMLTVISNDVDNATVPLSSAIRTIEKSVSAQKDDVRVLKNELMTNQKTLREQILDFRNAIYSELNGATNATIQQFIDERLGVKDGKIEFYMFYSEINNYVNTCVESNNDELHNPVETFTEGLDVQEKVIKDLLGKGAELLKNIKIDNNQVKAIRDVIAPAKKFKPYGAIKYANNITKGLGYAGAGIEVAIEAYNIYKEIAEAKKLTEIKKNIKDFLDNYFAEFIPRMDGERFFEEFAPSYIEMVKILEIREAQLNELRNKLQKLEDFKQKVMAYNNSIIEDVEFEEV